MSVLKKGDFRPPTLAKQTVEVPELGGALVVRGMTLTERLTLAAEGDTQYRVIARVLAWCALLEDGTPAMTEEEWEAFGSKHMDACIRLFTTAQQLSLLTEAAVEKKSESTPT